MVEPMADMKVEKTVVKMAATKVALKVEKTA